MQFEVHMVCQQFNQVTIMFKAFMLGMVEFRKSFTTHHDDLDLADAYDHGRDMAHHLTLRKFEG